MRLRLFENFNDDGLLRDIKDCFSDLIDDDQLDLDDIEKDENEVIIHISLDSSFAEEDTTFYEYFDNMSKSMGVLKQIKNALDKLYLIYDGSEIEDYIKVDIDTIIIYIVNKK